MELAVPKQIQDQVEAANAIQAQLYASPPAEATPPAAVVETPPPAPEPVVEPVVPTPSPEAKTAPDPDIAQAYRTLQGKYNAEVPRLYQQLREQSEQLRTLQARLEAAEKRPDPEVPATQSVTAEDTEFYGQPMVEFVGRVVADQMRKFRGELETRFAAVLQQVGSVQQTVEKSAAERFWDAVRGLVPDWAEIDNSPEWGAFLNTAPRFSTIPYRAIAIEAIQAGDPSKIAELVAVWRGASAPPPAPTPPVNPELKRQVAPSTARTSTPPTPQKVWTGAEYQYIFSQQAERDMPPKELAARQAEANAALGEGRVRW